MTLALAKRYNHERLFTQPRAAANPAIALWLQSTRLVGRVAELLSFGMIKQRGHFEQEATERTEMDSTLCFLSYLLLDL